ncbi:MAG: hypothetical protein ACD_4C00310G0001 [uncultured bacterium (gcode 4)]|uniref:Uncharacterized protein n=1 Tax=uncultured bacterium (gcode 4) TaxID=1234023 RepID=K2FWW3_9BACT|nr:MAG: hypothetical protein ACD_4C00310G0001 [uncultured bacterium (gcode 4)]
MTLDIIAEVIVPLHTSHFSSQIYILSASPSNATHKSDQVSKTFLIRSSMFSGSIGLGWWLGNLQSGSKNNGINSIHNFSANFSIKTPATQFHASATTFKGLMFLVSIKLKIWSTQSSVIFLWIKVHEFEISLNLSFSIWFLSFFQKSFILIGTANFWQHLIQLYSFGLWLAVIIIPTSTSV